MGSELKKKSFKGLGRGLDSLLPLEGESIIQASISAMRPNPYQPRCHFDEEKLKELVQSIIHHGIIQPLVVRKQSNLYEIIVGERRFRAAKIAGMTSIPVVIRILTEEQMMEIALIENLQREDLNPIEVANAYRVLMDKFGLKQEQLAARTGKSRPHVANILRLLKLSLTIQNYVSCGTLTMGHARALISLKEEDKQKQIADKVIKHGMSVRQLEDLVQRLLVKEDPEKNVSNKAVNIFHSYEDVLCNLLDTPVKIRANKNKEMGKIEIVYNSKDELERIMKCMKDTLGVEM